MVVYQIYPRSFCDGNGDGIGDIPGIISKLDYLQDLGIDMVWLCPVYQSPNDDNGYDISDYYNIMTDYGTMENFEHMVKEMHRRNIKLMMDLVLNHSSDEHQWFIESKKSRENPFRDYYIWHPGINGGPPNNWQSLFGGSAWELDSGTGEYYLHLFSKKQPDLNWKNLKLRRELYRIIEFWKNKGVDGFRLDVITVISKDFKHEIYANGPEIHKYLQEMHREVFNENTMVTVGEGPFLTTENAIDYVSWNRQELDMIFQFDIYHLGRGLQWYEKKKWTIPELKKIINNWDKALLPDGWNSQYFGNHDMSRMVSNFGHDGRYRIASSKMLFTLLLTLRGTPFIYNGDEIGMTNYCFTSLDEIRDNAQINQVRAAKKAGLSDKMIFDGINAFCRDNARTPIQWNSSRNAGFSTGDTTWLPVNGNYTEINVGSSVKANNSVLHYVKRLIRLRKKNNVLIYGKYIDILPDHPRLYVYKRVLGKAVVYVILNFSKKPTLFDFGMILNLKLYECVISNYTVQKSGTGKMINLKPFEARIYQYKSHAV